MAFIHRQGPRLIRPYALDADTDAITIGMAIVTTGATSGYVQNADGVADQVVGFAVDRADSPSSDGLTEVQVDISPMAIYEAPADAGTVTQSLVGKTMDVGADGLSVDINGSTTDDLYCVGIDTTANTVFVMLQVKPAGIV